MADKSRSLREITLEIIRIIDIMKYYQQDCTIIWMGRELTTIVGERAGHT